MRVHLIITFAVLTLGCSKENPIKVKKRSPSTTPKPQTTRPEPKSSAKDRLETKVRALIKDEGNRRKCNDLNGCLMVSKLTALGPKVAPVLADVYKTSKGDGFWRFRVLEAIGRSGNKSMGPFLVQVLNNDKYDPARVEAAFGIARLRLKNQVGDLFKASKSLEPERYKGALMAVGFALAKLGHPDGKPLIEKHMVLPEKTLRWDRFRPGIYAAGWLRMKQLRPQIETIAVKGSPFVRREAVIALKNMRDVDAVPTLIERLKDPVPGIRKEAQSALMSLTGYRHKSTYSQWSSWWKNKKKSKKSK